MPGYQILMTERKCSGPESVSHHISLFYEIYSFKGGKKTKKTDCNRCLVIQQLGMDEELLIRTQAHISEDIVSKMWWLTAK